MASALGIALVTGAGQGIGRAISLRLAEKGYDVAINDVAGNAENLASVGAAIVAKGRRTIEIHADVTEEVAVEEMVGKVVRELGGLDVMVANAGVCRVGTLLETDMANFEANMGVNVKGTFLCFKYAAKAMVEQGRGGRLIGASSVAGKMGHVNQIAYGAAKFAVRGLVQCAALELGRYGITVNSYAPGAIATSMLESIRVANEGKKERFYGDFYETVAERTAVKKVGQPEDVASLVSYLVSKEAHYITGQSYSVDGGVWLS